MHLSEFLYNLAKHAKACAMSFTTWEEVMAIFQGLEPFHCTFVAKERVCTYRLLLIPIFLRGKREWRRVSVVVRASSLVHLCKSSGTAKDMKVFHSGFGRNMGNHHRIQDMW